MKWIWKFIELGSTQIIIIPTVYYVVVILDDKIER